MDLSHKRSQHGENQKNAREKWHFYSNKVDQNGICPAP